MVDYLVGNRLGMYFNYITCPDRPSWVAVSPFESAFLWGLDGKNTTIWCPGQAIKSVFRIHTD